MTFRHCYVPSSYSTSKIILKKWRNIEGIVTGYYQLLKGDFKLVNCGIGKKIVLVKGKLSDCKYFGDKL